MANYKELRIMTHEQEFLVNTGQNTYALGNIDLTNVVFFTKSKKATYESAYEPFKVVDGGNYIISNQGTPSCSITFSTGFLDDKERIQVCREFLITSSQYITDEPNSIIVKDKLNQLISELTTLTEIIRKNQPKSDSKDVNHVFPDLLPNETFMMRDDGTLGAVTIDDVNSFIAEARTLINEHTTLKESELDTYTDTKKTELNSHTNLKIIELNSHTITKKGELDTYNLVKKGELDSYNLVKKGELDTYNEAQKTELNDYTEAEKIELNTHTNTKKSELDSYNLTKKSELDSYNLVKIGELDTHTTAKETEINNFTEEQKTEINNFTELQKIEINDLTETKKIEIIEVADDKIAEINNIIIENVDLPIATAVTKGIASFGTGFTVVNGHVTADGTNIVSANDGIIANADNIQLDTIDNLTTASSTKPLSAEQGKILNDNAIANFENGVGADVLGYIEDGATHTAGTVWLSKFNKGEFKCLTTNTDDFIDTNKWVQIDDLTNSERIKALVDYSTKAYSFLSGGLCRNTKLGRIVTFEMDSATYLNGKSAPFTIGTLDLEYRPLVPVIVPALNSYNTANVPGLYIRINITGVVEIIVSGGVAITTSNAFYANVTYISAT